MDETAYYCAGRAIVSCHIGIVPALVTIDPARGPSVVRPRTCGNPFVEAMFFAAGAAAMELLREAKGRLIAIEWSADEREMAELFAEISKTRAIFDGDVRRFRDGRVRAARAVLGKRWPEVEAVAAELARELTIDGARLAELVSGSPRTACAVDEPT